MRKISYLLVLSLIFLFSQCKENDVAPIDDTQKPELSSDSTQTLSINDFVVQLTKRGELKNGIWKSEEGTIDCIFIAGLWIGMEHNGAPEGNIVTDDASKSSNYISEANNKQSGVFLLNAGTAYKADNWPVEYGAPLDNSGSPKIYGDAMCWVALQSDTTYKTVSYMSVPIKGLLVTQAVYGFQVALHGAVSLAAGHRRLPFPRGTHG